MTPLEQYIRQAAAARGIDPDIAVKVARSEGGLNDPTRQSLVMKNGRQEPSYGPFQLLVGGGDTGFPEGLGNRALAAGIDPRNPADAYRGIDFALDTAAKTGWGQWYGAKAAGLGNFAGIGGQPSGSMPQAPQPQMAMADGPKGQEAYPAPVMGSMAVAQAPKTAASPVPPAVLSAAAAPSTSSKLGDIFGMMAAGSQQGPQFSPVQIMGPSAEQANALSNLIQALKGRVV